MGVDILCANAEGTSSLSIQVKTANNAAKNSYGETGFNWDVGVSAAGKFSPNLWYAFVDLRGNTVEKVPNVYFVPSRWVGMFIEKTWSRKLFYLKTAVASKVEVAQEHSTLVVSNLDGAHWALTKKRKKRKKQRHLPPVKRFGRAAAAGNAANIRSIPSGTPQKRRRIRREQ